MSGKAMDDEIDREARRTPKNRVYITYAVDLLPGEDPGDVASDLLEAMVLYADTEVGIEIQAISDGPPTNLREF